MNATLQLFLTCFMILACLTCCRSEGQIPSSPASQKPAVVGRLTGRIADDRLIECSGLDVSLATGNFFWAVNDSGDGSFLYALGFDGRRLGRVRVEGARNRDWEDLTTFLWQGRPMILIADCGDNDERHDTHTLYIVQEPHIGREGLDASAAGVAWQIVFSYPDRGHDAEAVAVDAKEGKVILLTKRDKPPILFELPLQPPSAAGRPLTARKITLVNRIPPPSIVDLRPKYGLYSSQPTAMDFSPDGLHAVVLTYKYAYLFTRRATGSWGAAFSRNPREILLPLPQDRSDLRQREAVCFAPDGRSVYVTSEGRGAGIFRFPVF